MEELYKTQLKKILDIHYRRTIDDIGELYGAIEKIKEKSKNNIFKRINLELTGNKLKELTQSSE